MNIKLLNKTEKDLSLIDELCVNANVNMKLDFKADYIGAMNEVKLLGAIAVNLKGKYFPQFKHIILRRDTDRRIGLLLIEKMEEYLRANGFNKYVTFVSHERSPIQYYALKLGFQPYALKEDGIWFFKEVGDKNV